MRSQRPSRTATRSRSPQAGALAISKSLQEKLPYDTLKDLKPVTLVAKVPEMLVVGNNVPAKSMPELLALAKAKPGQLNFASTGPGSMPHLAGELFKSAAGIDIVHVPYKGAAPAVNDIIGEQVQMVFLDIPVLLPQVQAGKVRPIAIGSRERAPSLPDVPTTGEVGLPQIEAENWYGMVAPAATLPAVIAKLHRITAEALKSPEVRDKLSSQGAISREYAGGIRSLHPERDRQVGQGRESGEYQGRAMNFIALSWPGLTGHLA